MWLVQEETCLQQHLAQVEQLFEEVLDVRLPPTSSSLTGSREDLSNILPGVPQPVSTSRSRNSRMSQQETAVPGFVGESGPAKQLQTLKTLKTFSAPPSELAEHFRWEAE